MSPLIHEPQLTEGFLGWTAGIIDGEGHITLFMRKPKPGSRQSKHFAMEVRVNNTDLQMVEALCSAWGGALRMARKKQINSAELFEWKITANQALHMLRLVEPFLITKKSLAQLCIKFQERQSHKIGLHHNGYRFSLTPEELSVRSVMYANVRALNDEKRKHLNPETLLVQ